MSLSKLGTLDNLGGATEVDSTESILTVRPDAYPEATASEEPPPLPKDRSGLVPHTIPVSFPFRPIQRAGRRLCRPFKREPPTFTRFSLLPTEIRLQIWRNAFVPRVHELHPCAKLYQDRMTFRSNASQTPSVFHASRESRAVALEHYQIMSYDPPQATGSAKGILRFYFCPELDTLLLNSLMGLFIMFMLLEEDEEYVGVGVMRGWRKVAFDADRAQLISLLSGIAGHAPQPRFKSVFPALEELIIAFDYTSKGKTRFRTSVWPGENGTTLAHIAIPNDFYTDPDAQVGNRLYDGIWKPMNDYLIHDYGITLVDDAEEFEDIEDGETFEAQSVTRYEVMTEEESMIVGGSRNRWESALLVPSMQQEVRSRQRLQQRASEGKLPVVGWAKVKRKSFIRGDIRYAFRKSCSALGLRPRGVFRRL